MSTYDESRPYEPSQSNVMLNIISHCLWILWRIPRKLVTTAVQQ